MRRSPLRDLIEPNTPIAANVHDFSRKNQGLINVGKEYLKNKSELAYNEQRDKSRKNYIEKYFVPALEDLKQKIDDGAWDYKGTTEQISAELQNPQDKEKKRNIDKKAIKAYLETLILSYTGSPSDTAAEEIVMFCDILRQREKKKIQEGIDSPGSEFIIILKVCSIV